jgi:hypothetical protein
MLDFVFKLFYCIRSNKYTNERAKLSKGSDAKPRVKSSKGHDSRATEGTSKRLYTIGTKAFFIFSSSSANELTSRGILPKQKGGVP